jgi:ABC-type amino acid transport system permease subunit
LTLRAHQIAVFLGLAAGTFFILLGFFGLTLTSFKTILYVAIASGISILAGLAILRSTFRKEDNAWLLPLKIFTLRVLRLHSLSAGSPKSRRSQQLR